MSRDSFHTDLKKTEEMLEKMKEIIFFLLSEIIRIYQQKELSAEEVQALIAKEAKLDDLEFKIEQHCMELLALQQPMAIDLRNIMCIVKISMDLERIGDHLRKIIRKTYKVIALGECAHFTHLAEMTILLRQMVEQIMIAYQEDNLELAKATLKIDARINELQRNLFQAYIKTMMGNPRKEVISSEIHLLFITRFLERIGDHVENIGERIIYKVTGKFNLPKKNYKELI